MGIFSFFKKKPFFSEPEKERILAAIRIAEKATSGEIRVYVEDKNPLSDTLKRAAAIFLKLKMQNTVDRNAVLLYIATRDRKLALVGDEGINQKVGQVYWSKSVNDMLTQFGQQQIVAGVEQCILQIGQTLKEKFPYNSAADSNELRDDIVYGK